MKKTIQRIMAGLLFVPVMAFSASALMPTVSYAVSPIQEGVNQVSGDNNKKLFEKDGVFTQVINTILLVLGAASVVMIIYGGIRYTLSGGDSSSVTAAKNTILYAVIGLVVAMLSFAISNFVVTALAK